MQTTRIEELARLLVDARLHRRKLDAVPAGLGPQSASEGLAVQAEVTRLLGHEIAAWKAATPLVGEPTRAPIGRPLVFQSGALLAPADYPMLIIEAEIGFELARDLPAREQPYTRAEVASAVGQARAAIEVADSRLANFHSAPAWDRVADNMGNGAIVLGTGRSDWQTLDFAQMAVALDIGAETVVARVGSHPSRDPLAPVVWLAQELQHTIGLRAGQNVITGSWTGMTTARAGDTVRVRFDGLGQVSVQFSSAAIGA